MISKCQCTVNPESTKNQTYATKLVKVPKEDFRLSEHKEAFHLGLFQRLHVDLEKVVKRTPSLEFKQREQNVRCLYTEMMKANVHNTFVRKI